MKNLLITIFLICITGILWAQKPQKSSLCLMNEKYMVGTWKMDTIFLKENTNLGDYKALYDQKFIELRDSTLFEFKSDYSYIKTVKTKITTGVWKISDDGTQIIIIKEDSNTEEKSRILELNNNLLMMSPLSESTNSKVILKKVD